MWLRAEKRPLQTLGVIIVGDLTHLNVSIAQSLKYPLKYQRHFLK